MISKELLSNVLNVKICIDDMKPHVQSNMLVYDVLNSNEINTSHINIYELAHKCKVWAYNKGFFIGSNCRKGITITIIETHQTLNYFEVDFEDFIEFEIKACQWILDNKETK